jgi:hypothetical protein
VTGPDGFDARGIVDASMSRDGTRIALLVRRGSLVEPWVARVERGASVTVTAPRRVSGAVTEAVDLAWQNSDTLLVLGTSSGTSLEVIEIGVGSSAVRRTSAPSPTVTTVTGAPGQLPLLGDVSRSWRATGSTWAVVPGVSAPAYPG